MKKLGIARRVDELGRIVLPIELRRSLDIKEGDPLDISIQNNTICLTPVRAEACAICGSDNTGMIKLKDSHICLDCLDLVYEEGKKVGR